MEVLRMGQVTGIEIARSSPGASRTSISGVLARSARKIENQKLRITDLSGQLQMPVRFADPPVRRSDFESAYYVYEREDSLRTMG